MTAPTWGLVARLEALANAERERWRQAVNGGRQYAALEAISRSLAYRNAASMVADLALTVERGP